MTSQQELDGLLGAFLSEGPEQVADRVIDAALGEIEQTRQRRALRLRFSVPPMNALSRLATAAVIGVLLFGAAFYFSRLAPPPVSSSPTPSVASGPSEPAVVGPSPTAGSTESPSSAPAIRAGSLIAFIRTTDKPNNTSCPGYDPLPTCPTARLWIVGSDGSGAHELFPDGFGGQTLFGWSPDGTRLFYSDDGKLYLTDASGSEPVLVDTGCLLPCRGDYSPALSSDGAHLVFVRTSLDAEGYDGRAGIATMDLASGQIAELNSTAPAGGGAPGWSPDARQIVFFRGGEKDLGGPFEPIKSAVFIVGADGQNLRQISPTSVAAEYASWSPDGARILFTSPETDGGNVYTLRPDGTDLRQLTTDGISTSATWTPDGRILFVRRSGGAGSGIHGFWAMDADGANAAELVPGPITGATAGTVPLWQPTGGASIVAPPWHPSTGTLVGPPPPTPVATQVPSLGPGFSWTGSMSAATSDPNVSGTATLLADGRVLVTQSCETAAQLYDPAAGTFSPTGSMTATHSGETATRLLDGRVLLAGGGNCGSSETVSAELYDPLTGAFSPTGSMSTPRFNHTATLLYDGRVLIVGGTALTPRPTSVVSVVLASYAGRVAATASDVLASAELFDPASGTFSPTGSMSEFRDHHTATLLQDGRVLVVGGGGEGYDSRTTAELFDPATGTFSPTGSMAKGRALHSATLLPDGRVLIAGGRAPSGRTYASAEFYDPSSASFSSAGSMSAGRQQHTATILPDGHVLITGGYQYDLQTWMVLSSAELFVPANGFTPIGSMGEPRLGHTATLLDDGRVLIAGGEDIGHSGGVGLTSAVLYQP